MQYPPAPQYAPQQFQQPYQPVPVPGGYGPPAMAQQYAGQALPQAYPQQPPAGPAPQHGTLADYANQPESGASFWKFKNPGDTNMGVVSRDLVDTDTVERTFRGQVQKRFDGSSDWVLRIPMTNADGTDAVWEVGGKDRTALKNALIAAGKADGIPAKGWAIRATFTHFQQNQQGQPSRIKSVEVMPPAAGTYEAAMNGQPQHVQQALQQAQPPLPNTVSQQAQTQAAQQYAQPAPQQPAPAQQFAAPPAAAAYPQAQPAPVPAPQAQPAPVPASQVAPQPQQFAQPQGQPAPQQFAGMPADAAQQFQVMLGGAQPPAQG
jgi:hypothetical protein